MISRVYRWFWFRWHRFTSHFDRSAFTELLWLNQYTMCGEYRISLVDGSGWVVWIDRPKLLRARVIARGLYFMQAVALVSSLTVRAEKRQQRNCKLDVQLDFRLELLPWAKERNVRGRI